MSFLPSPSAWLGWASGLAADLISPPICAGCDRVLTRLAVFCGVCSVTVIRVDQGADDYAFCEYGGAVAAAIRRLKYDRRNDLARPLGNLLRMVVAESALRADVVLPVPLHRSRLIERGFNQSGLLAQSVVADLGARLETRLLRRTVASGPQAKLTRGERLQNLDNAFAIVHPNRVRGRSVMLIDDVTTTGATLAACVRAVEACGAATIQTLVLARTARISMSEPDGAGSCPRRESPL